MAGKWQFNIAEDEDESDKQTSPVCRCRRSWMVE